MSLRSAGAHQEMTADKEGKPDLTKQKERIKVKIREEIHRSVKAVGFLHGCHTMGQLLKDCLNDV